MLLAHLGIQRVNLRLSSITGGLGLVQILFAHNARGKKSLRALILLLGPVQVCQLRSLGALLTLHRRLLFEGVNLHHRRAGRNSVARVDIDSRHLPFYLRHENRRVARFQRSDVLRGVIHRHSPCLLHFHWHTGR